METVRCLNKGSFVPERIILCVPEECQIDVTAFKNTELLHVHGKGQVKQRAAGFKLSDTAYTLQIDDDILVDKHCLKNLASSLAELGTAAVTPALINKDTGCSLYHLESGGVLRKLYYWLINGASGYTEGSITLAGTCFGIDSDKPHAEVNIATDWVPGGCLLHKTENLVLDDFYPFDGKAFAEDLIHSLLLKQNGIELYVNLEAQALVDPQPAMATMNWQEFSEFLEADRRAREYFLKLKGLSNVRLFLYHLCQIAYYGMARLQQKRSL